MRAVNIALAQYKSIKNYSPRISDFIIWHGWFSHYYGVISSMRDDKITIITAGLPCLLFSYDSIESTGNSKEISLNKIRRSRGGTFSILQGGVWYV